MPRCTHKGCGKDYDTADNPDGNCVYHSGTPVFHEGLKSWSCCSDVNKPVLDFDEFMRIPGCARGSHTDEVPKVAPPVSKGVANVTMTQSDNQQELFVPIQNSIRKEPTPANAAPAEVQPPVQEEEDDLTVPVNSGTVCRRKGCGAAFVSDSVSRLGDGEGTVCTYHPSDPIFHEGSKGYLCCKRRVLEFEEFLKIPGCKTGRHLFVSKPKNGNVEEELIDCRYDHYQTRTDIHLSIYAKQVDRERSQVRFEENSIVVDLCIPVRKQRFRRTLSLFGPIDPFASTVNFLGNKVEAKLKKSDNRSWALLEKTDRDLGNINFTFGVGGRVGTIGAK